MATSGRRSSEARPTNFARTPATSLRELIRTDYTYRHHASRAQGAGGSVHVSADVSGSAASPPGPDSSEGDADSYGAHYDNGTRDDEDVPPAQPRASFADIRGERMST